MSQNKRFSVLVVDDDNTCRLLLKEYLEKWNLYQVTTAKNAQEALDMLRLRSYDLVVSDVHMPAINGLELLKQINQEFHLPVILISADSSAELMWTGIKTGAQCFMVKPIMANDLKDIWQYSAWWKANKKKSTSVITEMSESSQQGVKMADHHYGHNNNTNAGDETTDTGRRNQKVVWTTDLHNRFVEAILVIGYHEAVPKNILKVMNVPGITKGHIASHIQRYRKFLKEVLDGKINIESNDWIDLNYNSSIVSGNPDLFLLNQLKEKQRKGILDPVRSHEQRTIIINVRAPNGSLSNQYRPLPPYTGADPFSSGTAPLRNNFYSQPSINMGGEGSSNINNENNLNPDQMENNHEELNIDISLSANQFGNTSAMNAQQSADGERVTDASWFKDLRDWLDIEIDEGSNKDYNPDGSWFNNIGDWPDIEIDEGSNKDYYPEKQL